MSYGYPLKSRNRVALLISLAALYLMFLMVALSYLFMTPMSHVYITDRLRLSVALASRRRVVRPLYVRKFMHRTYIFLVVRYKHMVY